MKCSAILGARLASLVSVSYTHLDVYKRQAETRWAASDWCSMALAHGLQACWSTPISSTTGKVLGTFAIYFAQPRTPMPQHQILIDQFTHVASITIERAQTDAALKRSEAFLAEAQHLSSTGSFSWNTVTDKITWSEELYHIHGLDPNVPITMERFGSRVHPDDIAHVSEHINRARGDGRDFEVDYRTRMDDRSVKYLHAVVHSNRDQDGQLEYIGAVQDVTERRLSEQALGKLRSELAHMARVTSLGALTASIAHEVNQPLSGVITNASTCLRMLAADPPNVDGACETARRTIRDGNRASDVIKRLRSLFSKKDSTAESVDLNAAAQEVIALSRSELQRKDVYKRQVLVPKQERRFRGQRHLVARRAADQIAADGNDRLAAFRPECCHDVRRAGAPVKAGYSGCLDLEGIH